MRILYLDADFATAAGDTGPRSYAFARRLRARGHQVSMLTSDRQFTPPPKTGVAAETVVEGVPVTVLEVGLGRSRSKIGRLWHHLRFALGAVRHVLACDRPEVIYVTSPPLSAIVPCLLARWIRGVPFVMEVREVWPEVPHGINLIRSRGLVFVLRQLALAGYRWASRIVALTDPAVNHIRADAPQSGKVSKIGTCCDLDLFEAGDGSAIRSRNGWAGKFVCLHVGPMVRSSGIEAILRVADALREDEQFVFWLVGGGEARAEIERNIRDRDLRNVFIQDAVSRSELPQVIAAADLCLLTVRRFRVLEQAGGERMFDYLAAGKPVLLNYSGWQRDLLEAQGAGLGTSMGDYGEFFERICRLCDRPELRADMGRKARRLAETVCHPDHWMDALEGVLRAAAESVPRAST